MEALRQLGARRLLWPSVLTALALPVLVGLGVWQVQRLAWKNGLIAAIAERTTREPVALEAALQQLAAKGEAEYVRVTARGTFHHDRERHLYYPEQQRGPGYHVFTPLELSGSGQLLMVNRGWVPEAAKAPDARMAGQVEGEVSVTGLLRAPEKPGLFAPDADRGRNIWFWRDLSGMLAAGPGSEAPRHVPMFLDAEGEAPGGWPKGGVTIVKLPNRHLEYAITWFGLAGALLAVYAAYALARLRGD